MTTLIDKLGARLQETTVLVTGGSGLPDRMDDRRSSATGLQSPYDAP